MTRTLTWVVVGGIVSLLVVGAVDALRSSGTPTSAPKTTAAPKRPAGDQISLPVETESVPPPRCTAQQLALTIENLGGGPALALLHVWAEPCRTRRLPIEIALLDRAGHSVEATVGVQPAFAPTTLSSNVALSAPFTFVYPYGEPKPVFAVADAGPYSARGRLPRSYGACLEDLGP